jgi:hypothetical protein
MDSATIPQQIDNEEKKFGLAQFGASAILLTPGTFLQRAFSSER